MWRYLGYKIELRGIMFVKNMIRYILLWNNFLVFSKRMEAGIATSCFLIEVEWT